MSGVNVTSELKFQGVAILVMVGLAIISVLGMVLLGVFGDVVANGVGLPLDRTTNDSTINATIQVAVIAFVAGFALVGTFATITMLVIVTKAIVGIVRGLR